MTDAPLTPERFAELADAYGASLLRWPEAVREEARRMAAADPALQRLLMRADALDARLEAWRVAAPSPLLQERVRSSWRRPLSRRVRMWWAGLGIATAMAGAAAGSIAAAATLPADHAPVEESTVFGDVSAGQEV
jgi:hypothetical protein